jgi:hypothetical protein
MPRLLRSAGWRRRERSRSVMKVLGRICMAAGVRGGRGIADDRRPSCRLGQAATIKVVLATRLFPEETHHGHAVESNFLSVQLRWAVCW